MINFANGSEPIINPWLFYLADILDAAKIVICIVAMASAVMAFVYLGSYSTDRKYKKEEELKNALHSFKISTVTCAISLSVAMFIPYKNTIYTMAIAQALTPDNIKIIYDATGKTAEDILNGGSEFIKDIMDYGVEKINEIRSGSSEEEE